MAGIRISGFDLDADKIKAGVTVQTAWATIPGIGTGSAYADEDAFGTSFKIDSLLDGGQIPKRGIIQTFLVIDDDDEDIDVDLFLFRHQITSGTDNSAYAPLLNDQLSFLGVITNSTRRGVSGVTFGDNDAIGKVYYLSEPAFYCQAVARGALNIAAGKSYRISLGLLADV